jgi:hypothetical protein
VSGTSFIAHGICCWLSYVFFFLPLLCLLESSGNWNSFLEGHDCWCIFGNYRTIMAWELNVCDHGECCCCCSYRAFQWIMQSRFVWILVCHGNKIDRCRTRGKEAVDIRTWTKLVKKLWNSCPRIVLGCLRIIVEFLFSLADSSFWLLVHCCLTSFVRQFLVPLPKSLITLLLLQRPQQQESGEEPGGKDIYECVIA